MNTIKIKLSTSGRIAALDKNFPLYQGQFQNTLLNVIVPTEILAPNFDIQHFIGNMSDVYPITDPALQTALDIFVANNTSVYESGVWGGRAPKQGDVVFYTDTTNDKYYRAVYGVSPWGFTEVPYFTMGNFAGTSVKVGVLATQRNGVQYKSASYYMRYVKKFTANDGIEYALYERMLPRAFTTYAGQGQNAPIVIANVVNSTADGDVENIVTSQTCALEVLPSTQLDGDTPIAPTAQEEIWDAINGLTNALNLKQDKTDNALHTTDKTVIGAINELEDLKQDKTDVSIDYKGQTTVVGAINKLATDKQEATDNSLQTSDNTIVGAINEVKGAVDGAQTLATENAQKIADIEAIIGTGENYIGTMTITTDIVPLPNPTTALNNFVQTHTSPSRNPQGGDVVIIIQKISGATDKAYKYIFNGTSWIGYEIPPVELAANGTAGIVSGTYGVGSTNNVLIDIVGGEVKNIYVKEGGNYTELSSLTAPIKTSITNIINGTTTVGKATQATNDSNGNNIATSIYNIINGVTGYIPAKATAADTATSATNDGNGNNIVNTYMTKTAGATKGYVQDYALPKEFNNVLYLSASGFSDEIPTTPASGIQFTATAGLGETLVGTCEYELGDLKMQLSRKNGYSARLFIRFKAVDLQNPMNTYRYKVLTYLQKAGQARTLLSSELLPETSASLDEGYIRAVDFGANFDELVDAVFDLENGDKIIQEYYFIQSSSFLMTVDIFSNSVYPSRMNLNTSTTTIVYRETEVGETIYISPDISDITRDAEFGAIDISVDNDELSRLSAYHIPSNIVIHLPDLSGIAGISPSDRIIGISSTTPNYFFAIKGTNDFVTVEDLAPYRKTNGQYFVSGIVVDQGTIQLIAPNIMSIRGTLTLTAANWSSGAYSATVSGLQDTDDIFFEPNSADDEIVASEVALSVVSTSGTTVNFAAGIDPTADITLKYTIRKN